MMLVENVWLRVLFVLIVVMIQDSGRICAVFGSHLPSLVVLVGLESVTAEVEEGNVVVEDSHRIAAEHVL